MHKSIHKIMQNAICTKFGKKSNMHKIKQKMQYAQNYKYFYVKKCNK